jgi:short subunit dehydrogenase-like uncharacterized protein
MPRPRSFTDREWDVLLWGATGYTGRLVAEYLLRHGPAGLRWAMGGRSREKLERTRSELGPAASAVPIVVADAMVSTSLDPVVRRARVVATTVGPYARYGAALVAACARHGIDYCDLTGEVTFMRRTIDAHDAEATRTGARIVHACGFDSIPSDLGTLVLEEEARRVHGRPATRVRFLLVDTRGGLSGGTAASALALMEDAGRDREVRRLLADPYALDPPGGARGPDGRDPTRVRWDEDARGWVAPFVMGTVNTRVVRRSNALLGYPWGRDFSYEEWVATGRGAAGLARAAGMTAGLAAFALLAAAGPTRGLVRRLVPAPGEGPTKLERDRGHFEVRLVGRDAAGARTVGTVIGTSDPGYGETAKMLAESALCLALDEAGFDDPGGVRTPAASMGMRLVERLRRAGMTFRAAAA